MVTRLINERIIVQLNGDSVPIAFLWRKRVYRVNGILSSWREPSKWWEGKPSQLKMRVSDNNGTTGFYEICQVGTYWFMDKVLD
jgi:hypothetical protein